MSVLSHLRQAAINSFAIAVKISLSGRPAFSPFYIRGMQIPPCLGQTTIKPLTIAIEIVLASLSDCAFLIGPLFNILSHMSTPKLN